MGFRSSTSFNRHDTSMSVGKRGRIQIDHGVKERCNLILRFFREEWNAFKDDLIHDYGYASQKVLQEHTIQTLEHLVEKFHALPKGHTYTTQDIKYAIKKLIGMGLLEQVKEAWAEYGYRLTFSPDDVEVHFKVA